MATAEQGADEGRSTPSPAATRVGVRSRLGRIGPAATGNDFGLLEAAIGFVAGFVLASLAAGAYLAISHHSSGTTSYGEDLASLCGLWVGLLGAAVLATRPHPPAPALSPPTSGAGGATQPARPRPARYGPARSLAARLSSDYGLRFRPVVDVPLGILVGVASQYALVPLFELPLAPFVHNLSQQIGKPAEQLTSGVYGPGLAVLGLFVCVGSPFVEEVFFRGLLLRALLGKLSGAGRALGPTISIVATSLLFALAHFEAIQFLALAGFGGVLGILAWRTGRLGPGMIAHASFNATAIIAIARSH